MLDNRNFQAKIISVFCLTITKYLCTPWSENLDNLLNLYTITWQNFLASHCPIFLCLQAAQLTQQLQQGLIQYQRLQQVVLQMSQQQQQQQQQQTPQSPAQSTPPTAQKQLQGQGGAVAPPTSTTAAAAAPPPATPAQPQQQAAATVRITTVISMNVVRPLNG